MVNNHNKDVINQVLITEEVRDKWMELAVKLAQESIQTLNIDPGDIPDEMTEVVGKKLRMHVTMPDGQVLAEMLIDEDQWAWMQS